MTMEPNRDAAIAAAFDEDHPEYRHVPVNDRRAALALYVSGWLRGISAEVAAEIDAAVAARAAQALDNQIAALNSAWPLRDREGG